MSAAPEFPPEVSITDARSQFAELVNQAVYKGTPTYLTRHGRRVAAIVPVARAEADAAKAREDAVTETCQALWASVQGADDETKAQVRAAIDQLLESAEDDTDVAAVRLAETTHPLDREPWDDLKAELGL